MSENNSFKKYFNRRIKFAIILAIVIISSFYFFVYFITPIIPKYPNLFYIFIVIFLSFALSVVFGFLIWDFINQIDEIKEARKRKREFELKEWQTVGNIRSGMTIYSADYYKEKERGLNKLSENNEDCIMDLLEEFFDDKIIDIDSRQPISSELIDKTQRFQELNHIISSKYPHRCFNPNCNKKLYFSEAWSNALDISFKEFVKIWSSPYVQFYCCSCYQEEKLKNQSIQGKRHVRYIIIDDGSFDTKIKMRK